MQQPPAFSQAAAFLLFLFRPIYQYANEEANHADRNPGQLDIAQCVEVLYHSYIGVLAERIVFIIRKTPSTANERHFSYNF